MQRVEKSNHFEFECSGREFSAYGGVIGLSLGIDGNEFLDELTVREGYDGSLGESIGELTLAERDELAEHMINRWQAFKEFIPT